jgi:hypothetical protein
MEVEGLVLRFGKAAIVAVVMFIAVLFISGEVNVALVAALVPLVLGGLGIMIGLAYGVTGLVFLGAVVLALFPSLRFEEERGSLMDHLVRARNEAVDRLRDEGKLGSPDSRAPTEEQLPSQGDSMPPSTGNPSQEAAGTLPTR